MKDKFQITKEQLQQIIKEEYASMSKENARTKEIKKRLATINEELKTLPETLSEVEASGTKKLKSTGWTGDGEGDVKYGEKFEKIGSHLKEDEEFEGDLEVGGEEEAGDMEEAEESGYFEGKFAELGKELDEKMGGESEEGEDAGEEMTVDMGLEMGNGEESEESEVEEIEVEAGDDEEVSEGVFDFLKKKKEKAPKPKGDDSKNVAVGVDYDGNYINAAGEIMEDDSEEVSNDLEAAEAEEGIMERRSVSGAGVLSEGFTSSKKTALNSELERMKRLAKL